MFNFLNSICAVTAPFLEDLHPVRRKKPFSFFFFSLFIYVCICINLIYLNYSMVKREGKYAIIQSMFLQLSPGRSVTIRPKWGKKLQKI